MKLKDFVSSTVDNRGRNPEKYYEIEQYPVIDNYLIKNFIYPDMSAINRYIDQNTFDHFLRGYVHKNMPIMTLVGNGIGNVTLVPSDDVAIIQNTIGFECNDKIDEVFLYYYLLYRQEFIRKFDRGSGQPSIRKTDLLDMEVNIPNISKQKRIREVLFSIDEKIENNNVINNNLEQQIEMILLKTINGTDTQPVKLGDYLYIKGRIGWKGLKKSEYLPISNYRIINGESLTLSGIDWNKAGYISAERYEESPEIMLSIGDILLSKDGTIGKIGYVDKLDVPTSVASGIFVIRNTRESEISTQFIYYLLKSKLFKDFISSRTEGSVIPHLYQKDFMEFEFNLPSPDDMKAFDSITATMFSLVFSNLNENERLTHLRNSLLPKLMSGELDVSNIDI